MARLLSSQGFSLTETVVAVAVLAAIVMAATPLYRSFVDSLRRAALIEEMVALAPLQESIKRSSGRFASGEFDRVRDIDSFPPTLRWRPSRGDQWVVVAFDDFWVARAGGDGIGVCRRFPENVRCTNE